MPVCTPQSAPASLHAVNSWLCFFITRFLGETQITVPTLPPAWSLWIKWGNVGKHAVKTPGTDSFISFISHWETCLGWEFYEEGNLLVSLKTVPFEPWPWQKLHMAHLHSLLPGRHAAQQTIVKANVTWPCEDLGCHLYNSVGRGVHNRSFPSRLILRDLKGVYFHLQICIAVFTGFFL